MPRKRVRSVRPELNLTSMLDVVFNLIVFFILITNFAAAELPRLANSVPRPDASVAAPSAETVRVIVSVIGNGTKGDVAAVQIGSAAEDRFTVPPGGEVTDILDAVAARIGREKLKNKDMTVTLRADRAIQFKYLQPIMMAISKAGISKVHLVAEAAT